MLKVRLTSRNIVISVLVACSLVLATCIGSFVSKPQQALALSSFQAGAPSVMVQTPSTVTMITGAVSDSIMDYYQGAKRIVSAGSTTFVFYPTGNYQLAYKASTDNGKTWGAQQSAGVRPLGSDVNMWTLASLTSNDLKHHVVLFYYVPTSSDTSTNFYAKHGVINGTKVTWSGPVLLFTLSGNAPGCQANTGGGSCDSAAAGVSSTGVVYGGFRYFSTATGSYHYQVFKSSNAGATWSSAIGDTDSYSGYRFVMTLSKLAKGEMLLSYVKYDDSSIYYRVYDGKVWSDTQAVSGYNLPSFALKEVSAATDSSGSPYLVYLSGGNSGSLVVARWNGSGVFSSFEVPSNALSHSLPSITITSDGVVRIYSIAGGKIYETDKVNGKWQTPANPFGTSFSSPDELTSAYSTPSALWEETNSTGTYLKYG